MKTNEYIYTNSSILYKKILYIIDNNVFNISKKDINVIINENKINMELYNKICKTDIPEFIIKFKKFNTNSINILKGLYDVGSEKIYIENNKNIFNSNIHRYSEHYGYLYYNNNNIDNIIVDVPHTINANDNNIFLPINSKQSFNVEYMYHTHPITPNIGSRIKHGILYEFPSVNDIIHYIEHHNYGKLLISLIYAPEGIYIIHKYNFNREKIIIDIPSFIKKIQPIYYECNEKAIDKYTGLDYDDLFNLPDNFKISSELFYHKIIYDFTWINTINDFLINYDLFIEYIPKNKLNKTSTYLLPDLYLPFVY